MKSIVTNGSTLAIGGLVAQFIFVAIEMWIARTFGSDAYGVFALVYAVVLTTTLVVDLGLTWYSVEKGTQDSTAIPFLLGTTTTLKGIIYIAIYPIFIIGLYFSNQDPLLQSFLLIFFFYAPLLGIQDSLSAVNSAHESMHATALYLGLSPIVIGVAVYLSVLFSDEALTLNYIGFCYVGGGALVTLAWWINTTKKTKPVVKLRKIPGILKSSSLYGMTNVLAQIYYKSDVFMLSIFSGFFQVGIYAAGYKFLDVSFKIPTLAVRVFSPPLYRLWEQNKSGYNNLADVFLKISLAWGGCMGLFVFYSANILISSTFGSEFIDSALILQVLSLSFLLKFISSCLQSILSTRKLHRVRTQFMFVSTVVMVLLLFALVPTLGAKGAAVSVVLADFTMCGLFLWATRGSELQSVLLKRFMHFSILVLVTVLLLKVFVLADLYSAFVACVLMVILMVLTRFVSLSDFKVLQKSTK